MLVLQSEIDKYSLTELLELLGVQVEGEFERWAYDIAYQFLLQADRRLHPQILSVAKRLILVSAVIKEGSITFSGTSCLAHPKYNMSVNFPGGMGLSFRFRNDEFLSRVYTYIQLSRCPDRTWTGIHFIGKDYSFETDMEVVRKINYEITLLGQEYTARTSKYLSSFRVNLFEHVEADKLCNLC